MKLARKSILTLAAILIAAVLTVSVFVPAATAYNIRTAPDDLQTTTDPNGFWEYDVDDEVLTVKQSGSITITGDIKDPISLKIEDGVNGVAVIWKATTSSALNVTADLITISDTTSTGSSFKVDLDGGESLLSQGPILVNNSANVSIQIEGGTLKSTGTRTNTVYSKGEVSVESGTEIIASGNNSVGVYAENDVEVDGATITANGTKGKAVYSKKGDITLDGGAVLEADKGGPVVEARGGGVTVNLVNIIESGHGVAIRASESVIFTFPRSWSGVVEANYDYSTEGSGGGGCDAGFGAGGLLLLAGTALLGRGKRK
jgi:hypothetical protein